MANVDDVRNPVSRQKVYEVIDQERTYQKLRWGYNNPASKLEEAEHCVCDFLVYMKDYLNDAFRMASRKPGNKHALDFIRKVTALGVACMEQNGVVERDLSNVVNVRENLQEGQ